MPEKQCQQQHLNVGTVNVGVAQDTNLAVAQIAQVRRVLRTVRIDPDSDRDVVDFGVGKQAVPVDLPGIEDLAAQWAEAESTPTLEGTLLAIRHRLRSPAVRTAKAPATVAVDNEMYACTSKVREEWADDFASGTSTRTQALSLAILWKEAQDVSFEKGAMLAVMNNLDEPVYDCDTDFASLTGLGAGNEAPTSWHRL